VSPSVRTCVHVSVGLWVEAFCDFLPSTSGLTLCQYFVWCNSDVFEKLSFTLASARVFPVCCCILESESQCRGYAVPFSWISWWIMDYGWCSLGYFTLLAFLFLSVKLDSIWKDLVFFRFLSLKCRALLASHAQSANWTCCYWCSIVCLCLLNTTTSPTNWLNWSRCCFGCRLVWAFGWNQILGGGPYPPRGRGNFLGHHPPLVFPQ